MSTLSADELLQAALKLPESDRLYIAAELLASIPPPPGILCEDDPGFFEELERRSDEHRRDPSKAIPWEEAMRRIEADLDERRAKRDQAANNSPSNST